MAQPDLLTVEEVAALLHLHPATVRAMAAGRKIPAARVGHRWLFLRTDVMAWVQSRRQGVVQPSRPVVDLPRVVEPPKLDERRVTIFKRASWRQAAAPTAPREARP